MGTVRILYEAGTIRLQAAMHPKRMLGALNMTEEEESSVRRVCNPKSGEPVILSQDSP